MAQIDDQRDFIPVNIAVLTVSDTRTAANDTSGDALAERIAKAGHRLAARAIEKDDAAAIDGTAARLDRRSGDRRGHHDGRHRHHRARRDARSVRPRAWRSGSRASANCSGC